MVPAARGCEERGVSDCTGIHKVYACARAVGVLAWDMKTAAMKRKRMLKSANCFPLPSTGWPPIFGLIDVTCLISTFSSDLTCVCVRVRGPK